MVRDISDISRPSTVAILDIPSSEPRFVSATDVSWLWTDQRTNLFRTTIATHATTLVAACAGLFDWSPDGTAVVYTTQPDSVMTIHQLSAGRDRVLDSVPGLPLAFGCESQTGADTWDFRLSYSPDAGFISLVLSVGSVFGIWTGDGKQQRIDLHATQTMTAWSGNSLYFRDGKGVERWHNGTQSLVLSGLIWIRPKASPAGGEIVYEARDAYRVPNVYLLDTASGSVHLIAKLRSEPAFLTSRYLWYQGERPCTSADPYPCGDATTIATGKTYIYDLQTGTEYQSIITRVYDVWPHPA